MHPRQRVRYRLRLATHHSPASTAVPRTNAYRRNSPSSQWEAVEEVSLIPVGHRRALSATAGSAGYGFSLWLCRPRAVLFAAPPYGGLYP